ncbi:MAG: F0F1 ATP synthase subunit A [Bacteroidales bacterium]|nr:F0F1 ATP synthase subunit A [Lachnoclostridium sp.]MCM1384825.1 F0F1 ATP synthase subunit A [Lachnoclostridium sp.]MCM1466426.1 F0F1 ATP synthase subunit A [Bacteroidales bacterium]
MGGLAEELLNELECEEVFSFAFPEGIPLIGGFEVIVRESVVITWGIMLAVVLFCIFLTRNMKVRDIGKRQLIAETIVTKLEGFVSGMVGEEGKRYVPYLATVLVFIGLSNMMGVFGMKPPTKDLNVTVGLSVLSIILIEYAGWHKRGFKGWLKSFAEPVAVVAPIKVLELVIRPLSLCMRLFGNVLGAFVIMEMIKIIIPVAVPVPFSLYFDIFDGLIQAYVFVFLTSLFIKEAVEE